MEKKAWKKPYSEFVSIPRPKDFKPVSTFEEGHRKAGSIRCQGWSGSEGAQCTNSPTTGRPFCRWHGGRAAIGPRAGNYKHGKYAQSLPLRLAANYEASRNNAELVSLKEEIALVDSHTLELIEQMKNDGHSLETWKQLKETLGRYNQTKKDDARELYLSQMLDLIEKGSRQAAVWSDIYKAVGMRRRLVDTEYRRQVQYGHMLNVEQLMAVIGRLLAIMKQYVDRDNYARLAGELRQLVHQGDNGSTATGLANTLPRPETDRIRAD